MRDNFPDPDDPYRYAHQSPIGDVSTPGGSGGTDSPAGTGASSSGSHVEFITLADGTTGAILVSNGGGSKSNGPGGIPFISKLFSGAAKVVPAIAAIYGSVNNDGQTEAPVVITNPSSPSAGQPTPTIPDFAGLLSALTNAPASAVHSQSDAATPTKTSMLPFVLIVVGLVIVGYVIYKHRKSANAA